MIKIPTDLHENWVDAVDCFKANPIENGEIGTDLDITNNNVSLGWASSILEF